MDNYRGRFDSPHLEAFLTCEGRFPARVPHKAEVEIDPSRFFIQLTSNGVDTTRDLANRSSIVRIRKRPGVMFRQFPAGDLLAHVRTNQAYYLGCVFAVVREWVAQGKPSTRDTRHDFREWCGVLDWICRNILHEAPLMDGHQQSQQRVSDPALVFLRALALAVVAEGKADEPLIASQLCEIADSAGLEVPGGSADEDRNKKAVGGIMARVFKTSERVDVDQWCVIRDSKQVARDDGKGSYSLKTYVFTLQVLSQSPAIPSHPSNPYNVQKNGTNFLKDVTLTGVAGAGRVGVAEFLTGGAAHAAVATSTGSADTLFDELNSAEAPLVSADDWLNSETTAGLEMADDAVFG